MLPTADLILLRASVAEFANSGICSGGGGGGSLRYVPAFGEFPKMLLFNLFFLTNDSSILYSGGRRLTLHFHLQFTTLMC